MTGKWKTITLDEAVEIYDSLRKPVNSKARQNRINGKSISELYPYYGATGQVGYIDGYITDDEYVLLGEDGAPFLNPFAQKAYIIKGKTWVNNHAHVLKSKTSNKFLCYYLNYFDYRGYVSGTTRLKLTQSQMRKIPFPSVPSDEQERIVTRIEELFSELDKAAETLQTTKKQLAVYRQAVLKEAFDFSDDVKTELHTLTDKIGIGPFGTSLHKSDYIENGIPVINPQHIKNQKVVENPKVTITDEKAEELSTYRFMPNDIVMGRRGEMGRTAPISNREKGWVCGTGSILIRLKPDYDANLYSQILSSPNTVRYLKDNSTGTTMDNLNEDIVKGIPVPVITKKKQKIVFDKLEQCLSVCDSIEKTVDAALSQAEAMRQSILKKAFEEEI